MDPLRCARPDRPAAADEREPSRLSAAASVGLTLACAEICRTSAHFMLLGTAHHKHTCAECADVCEDCARSCEQVGDMQDCVEQCRACAESCRKMAA